MHQQRFVYVTPEAVKPIQNYKYEGEDTSFCTRLFTPFWDFAVSKTPSFVVPNMITTISLLCVFVSFIMMLIYSPNLNEEAPSWVYLTWWALWVTYMHTDAIDGKLARKTGTCSALGEMYDHGGDALITLLMGLMTIASIGLGNDNLFSVLLMLSVSMFSHLSIWENYITEKLDTNGVTESLVQISTIPLLTGLFGLNMWTRTDILDMIGIGKFVPFQFSPNMAIPIAITASCFGMGLPKIRQCLSICRKTGTMRQRVALVIPYISTVVAFLLSLAFHWRKMTEYGTISLATFGLSVIYLQTRLIFARICQNDLGIAGYLVVTPFLLSFVALFYVEQYGILQITHLAYVVCLYIHFIVFSFRELMSVIGITFFTCKVKK